MKDLIEKAKSILEHMEHDPAAFWDEECHEQYDQMLDECHPENSINGHGYADLLRQNDPIAYRCGFADYMDGDTAYEFAKDQGEYQDISDAIDNAEMALDEYNEAYAALKTECDNV